MKIYGVAILAGCYLVGQFIGDCLGRIFNMSGNLGGVGIAMLLLILLNGYLHKKKLLLPETEQGILFWSSMYIPVIVAMSATQNVKAALTGGWVAFIVAIVATSVCFLLIPFIANFKRVKN
jgi:malonate transporter MadL subunit